MTLAQLDVLMRVHKRVNNPEGSKSTDSRPKEGLRAFVGLGG